MLLIEHCPVVGSSDGAPGGRAGEVNLKCVVGNGAQKKLSLTPAGRSSPSPSPPPFKTALAQTHRDNGSGPSKSVSLLAALLTCALAFLLSLLLLQTFKLLFTSL